MTFLKDPRLLLIVGLAIVCLFALRMCSSQYASDTVGSTGSSGVVAEGENNFAATEGEAGATAAENESVADDATVESPAAEETDAAEESAVTEETTASEETADKESTSEETDASGEEAGDNKVETETADAVEESNVEVVASTIGEAVNSEIKKITLAAPATSGELIPDLKADVSTIKDGMTQYGEKLDLVGSLLEKVTK